MYERGVWKLKSLTVLGLDDVIHHGLILVVLDQEILGLTNIYYMYHIFWAMVDICRYMYDLATIIIGKILPCTSAYTFLSLVGRLCVGSWRPSKTAPSSPNFGQIPQTIAVGPSWLLDGGFLRSKQHVSPVDGTCSHNNKKCIELTWTNPLSLDSGNHCSFHFPSSLRTLPWSPAGGQNLNMKFNRKRHLLYIT